MIKCIIKKDMSYLKKIDSLRLNKRVFLIRPVVSHIPQFGDATTSPAGDAAFSAGYVDVSAGDAHL
jgi:hypothetical protein